MKLSLKTLKRIHAQLEIGVESQADIARSYGMSSDSLTRQLCAARKTGILPPYKNKGRRKSIYGHTCTKGRGVETESFDAW